MKKILLNYVVPAVFDRFWTRVRDNVLFDSNVRIGIPNKGYYNLANLIRLATLDQPSSACCTSHKEMQTNTK